MILRITEKIVDDAIYVACEFCSGNHFSKYTSVILCVRANCRKMKTNIHFYRYALSYNQIHEVFSFDIVCKPTIQHDTDSIQ